MNGDDTNDGSYQFSDTSQGLFLSMGTRVLETQKMNSSVSKRLNEQSAIGGMLNGRRGESPEDASGRPLLLTLNRLQCHRVRRLQDVTPTTVLPLHRGS